MDHDTHAELSREEATFDYERAKSTVEAMEEFLDDPEDDGTLREDRAEELAGRFVGLVKSMNDNIATADHHSKISKESAD